MRNAISGRRCVCSVAAASFFVRCSLTDARVHHPGLFARQALAEKDALRETLARERKEHELFAARAHQEAHFAARAAQEERERHAALGIF